VAILTTLFTIGSPVIAGSLPKPEGEPILAVSGNIAHTNDGDHALFDISMLEGLGTVKFRTKTPWYQEAVEFEGVPMKVLMDYVGAKGTEVTVRALDDYESKIPLDHFEKFEVILATKRDGKSMPIRDNGQIWIVYPYDSKTELSTYRYYSLSVWGIKEMILE